MKLLAHLGKALPLLLILATGQTMAQSTNTALNKELEAVDSRFFTAVFTAADKVTVKQMLAPGFTFTSGGKTRTRDKFLANLEHMWQQMEGGMHMRRILVAGSTQAHMQGKVAVQTGTQKLYAVDGDHEQLVEASDFRRQLTRKDGHWILLSEETHPASTATDNSSQSLAKQLAAADTSLFEAVFKTGDANALRAMLTDDFEFYHDRNGLVSTRADDFVAAVQHNRDQSLRRKTLPDTIQVYPLHGFGAIQTGMHQFYRLESGRMVPESRARFFHVWQKVGTRWKLKREFSFDHQAM